MNRPAGSQLALLLVLAPLACAGERPGPPAAADNTSVTRAPADSQVLRTKSGIEVWFTAARPATDSTGRPCLERVMEIRSAGRRLPIPLLYTGTPPHLLNDSMIEAVLWLHCRPTDLYRVSLRTGQPVRAK